MFSNVNALVLLENCLETVRPSTTVKEAETPIFACIRLSASQEVLSVREKPTDVAGVESNLPMLDAEITIQLDPELCWFFSVDPGSCCTFTSNEKVLEIISKSSGFSENTKRNAKDVPEIILHRTELSDRQRVEEAPVSCDRIPWDWSALLKPLPERVRNTLDVVAQFVGTTFAVIGVSGL